MRSADLLTSSAAVIEAELGRWVPRLGTGRALDRNDLVQEAWLVLLQYGLDEPLGRQRLRVRGAMSNLFRREWRQVGRVARTIRWPVYWPRPETKVHLPCRQYAARSGRWYAAQRAAA
jgi:hypothetical protein